MEVKQFFDNHLAHSSYAIFSNGEVAVIDPARNPQPYIDFADKHRANITAVLETHPHADFTSCHKELSDKFGAKIYVNPKVGVSYDFEAADEGTEIKVGNIKFKTLFTPGHSPDHNTYLLYDEGNKPYAAFTGDSLFVGDVGRPDLREGAGNVKEKRESLAGMMYDTINRVFKDLPDEVLVYPAHGAGSLCGKNLSPDLYSSMGKEKKENWAFQITEKDAFVNELLDQQPFVPKYFPYDVELNRTGVPYYEESIRKVPRLEDLPEDGTSELIIDARPSLLFRQGHYAGAINLQNTLSDKFETWLGAIIAPNEQFYLIAEDKEALERAIKRAAKIGYEQNIKAGIVQNKGPEKEQGLDLMDFRQNPDKYTIVDIRNASEINEGKIFPDAIAVPLPELRENLDKIPTDKPVVVHCAGGYRSTAGASIVSGNKKFPAAYDLGSAIDEFK
ncbi:MAG: rhodanese-like domain-containing protein [Candidatus Cyclobacteriaceae bacterium M2_1C_046]